MKSSDTSTSIATTGVGLRIDPPPAEWFLAKVTAVSTSGGFNIHSLEEVEPISTTYGYQTKPGGFTTSYAVELNNKYVPTNTIIYARFRCYRDSVGETYEFVKSCRVRKSAFYLIEEGDSFPIPVGGGPPSFTWFPDSLYLYPGERVHVHGTVAGLIDISGGITSFSVSVWLYNFDTGAISASTIGAITNTGVGPIYNPTNVPLTFPVCVTFVGELNNSSGSSQYAIGFKYSISATGSSYLTATPDGVCTAIYT